MGKKNGKSKLPKRVAGVKIPKTVRKGALAQFLGSHAGQIAVAEALALAAGAFAIKHDDADGDHGGVAGAMQAAGERVRESAPPSAQKLARALKEAAQTFRRVMEEDEEDAGDTAQLTASSAETDSMPSATGSSAKKKRPGATSSHELTSPH